MGYREAIESAEKYISDHLTDQLDPADIAERSGYSYFHFCHVFRAMTGKGLSHYILEKRLQAARVLLGEGKSVTYAAMEIGFDTVSGFTRAFTQMYGIPPSKFRASVLHAGGAAVSADLKGENKMEPEIIKKDSFKAKCLVIRPESEIDILESGGYWIGKDLPELKAASHEEAFSRFGAKVGAWMHDADGRELYYVYGDVLEDGCCGDAAPAGGTGCGGVAPSSGKIIEFPAAEYAVFKVPTASTHEEFVENLRATWKAIFNDWFDQSTYKFDVEKMDFEYYTLSGVSIYVPVQAK